jgi:hypothetical protein
MVAAICGLESESQRLEIALASVDIYCSCPIIRKFLESKTLCVSANLWRAISFFSYLGLCDLCF